MRHFTRFLLTSSALLPALAGIYGQGLRVSGLRQVAPGSTPSNEAQTTETQGEQQPKPSACPDEAGQAAAAIAAPQPPTLTPNPTAGTPLSGTGEPLDDTKYPTVKIWVCTSATQPTDPPHDCSPKNDPAQDPPETPSPKGATYFQTDPNGNFDATLKKPLTAKSYVWVIEEGDSGGYQSCHWTSQVLQVAGLEANSPTTSIEHFGIAGITVAAASSTSPEAKLFAELYGDLPLTPAAVAKTNGKHGGYATNFRFWGYARIGSISETNLNLTSSGGSNVETTASSAQVQQLVQSGEIAAGLEFRLSPWGLTSDQIGDKAYAGMPSLSFVVGGGGITPLSAQQSTSSPPAFQVTPAVQQYYTQGSSYAQYLKAFESLCPEADAPSGETDSGSGACYVAFYPQDRARFFSDYAGGIRLKTPIQVQKGGPSYFPSTFDATIGQNEYVTGGSLRNWVLHLGGASPLPYATGFFIFGGMDMAVTGRSVPPEPLLLAAPTTGSNAAIPSNTIDIVTPPPNRDRYLLGFGFDITGLIQQHLKNDAESGK